MMSPENMQKVLDEASKGKKKVLLTFSRNAIGEINYLLGMCRSKIVEFVNPGDEAVMMAVSMSRDWEHDDNRRAVIRLTDSFDAEWFKSRMRRALDSMTVAK